MRKKIIVLIAIIIMVIVGAIIGAKKIKESKIEYKIEEINELSYFKYNQDGKIGIIDRSGNVVIEAKYTDIIIPNPEKDIFICNNDTEKNVVLNSKGEELFSEYENVEPIKLKNIASTLCYEKSVLKYKKDGKLGLINFEGREITKNKYDSIENLQSTEGKFLISENNKYGVINLKGVNLVDTKYDKIETDEYYEDKNKYVYSGFIVSNTTEDGYKYGYIDYKGKELLEVKYNEIIRVDGLKDINLIVSENGKYGLYKGSKEVVEPQYESIVYNEIGMLVIQKNKKYGAIDLNGNIRRRMKTRNNE